MESQRSRDPDALSLSAAERVRKTPHVFGSEPDPAQEIRDALFTLAPVLHPVDVERLANQVEQRHARIEGRERVLEDHLHLAPERTELAGTEPADLDDRAVPGAYPDFARRRLDRSQDAPRRRRLAAPALAHQPERLPFVDVKVDAVHRADVADRPFQESLSARKQL